MCVTGVVNALTNDIDVFIRAVRWNNAMNMLFHRQTDVGMQDTESWFRSDIRTACDPDDIDLADLRADLSREDDRFTDIGSGWTLTAILRCVIRIGQDRPLVDSSFIPTPKTLTAKQALICVLSRR